MWRSGESSGCCTISIRRWPNLPDHPLQGAAILRTGISAGNDLRHQVTCGQGDRLSPRFAPRQSALCCDELAGFIRACAIVLLKESGLQAKSVRKKLKQKAFAAAVSRDEIVRGAEELGVDLDEHIQFVIDAMRTIGEQFGLAPR